MFDHARGDWEQAGYTIREHTDSPTVSPRLLDAIVIHYPGSERVAPTTWEQLRNMQRYYVDQRGYSLGYNAAVDQTGELWQVRGLDYQNAANRGHNSSTVSVQIIARIGEPASTAAAERVRQFVRDMRRWANRQLQVVGHRDLAATNCPGDVIYEQLLLGLFTPSHDPEYDVKLVDPPQRIYDSRNHGGPWAAGETRKIPTGRRGGVFVNVTVVNAQRGGFCTAWAAGPMPDVSIINYAQNDTISNSAWVPVAGDGTMKLYTYGECDLIVDLQAYGA
jgi:hypothetical protein